LKSAVIAVGVLNEESDPIPSTTVPMPLPARVAQVPPIDTVRMRWFEESVTTNRPEPELNTIDVGLLNRAVAAGPSAKPRIDPESVSTTQLCGGVVVPVMVGVIDDVAVLETDGIEPIVIEADGVLLGVGFEHAMR
jgi:hypothetical protein